MFRPGWDQQANVGIRFTRGGGRQFCSLGFDCRSEAGHLIEPPECGEHTWPQAADWPRQAEQKASSDGFACLSLGPAVQDRDKMVTLAMPGIYVMLFRHRLVGASGSCGPCAIAPRVSPR